MAENVAQAQPQPQPKSGGKLWIIIAIFVFLLLIGGGVVFFMLGSNAEHTGGDGKEHVERKPAVYYELERFVVNISKNKRQKFLQVNMQVLTRDEHEIDVIKLHIPKIRNNIIFLLSGQKAEVIATNEGKEDLRQRCLKEIQTILEKESGKPIVEDLFFTSFIMQ